MLVLNSAGIVFPIVNAYSQVRFFFMVKKTVAPALYDDAQKQPLAKWSSNYFFIALSSILDLANCRLLGG